MTDAVKLEEGTDPRRAVILATLDFLAARPSLRKRITSEHLGEEAWGTIIDVILEGLPTRTPSTTASTEGAWQPIETVGTFEEVTVYEAGNGQAIGHRDAMGEWWSPLPLRPLNMNPTHWKPLGPNPASPQGADR